MDEKTLLKMEKILDLIYQRTRLFLQKLRPFLVQIWLDRGNTDIIFAVIWLITGIMFFIQAVLIYGQISTTLSLYNNERFTDEMSVEIGGTNIGESFNDLSLSYNNNVLILQESIRSSAKLTFWLNTLSFLLAIMGLKAQIGQYLQSKRSKNKNGGQDEN